METTTTTETKQTRGVITGDEGAAIELDEAIGLTKNYRHRNPKATVSQFFGNKILNRILQQDGCLGIRIYYANSHQLSGWQSFFVGVGNFFIKVVADAEGEKKFVIVGVDENGEDQLPEDQKNDMAVSAGVKTFKVANASYAVADRSHPCPGSAGCPKGKLSGGARD